MNQTDIESKIVLLKAARLRLLNLHKSLIDIEREVYEKEHGQTTAGQFLNLLLSDESLEWLRKFSMLIVEIDEMFDLSDGYTETMIDRYITQMRGLLDLKSADTDFNEKYQAYLQNDSEIAGQHAEIKNLLAQK